MSGIVGPLFVRLRSDYFALVNLALAVIIFYLMQKVLADITNGDNGLWFLTNIASTPVLDLGKPNHFFIFALLVALAVWAFYKYLDDSIYGACCLATKINEDKLKFLGYSNYQRPAARVHHRQYDDRAGRRAVRGLSRASSARKSPARRVPPIRSWSPYSAGSARSTGPSSAPFAYTGMKDVISKLIGNWELFIGFLLVFIMLAGEKGIWGTLQPWLEKLLSREQGRRRGTADEREARR